MAVSTISAGTIASPYQVGTWQGFHNAAISHTFDDNCSNQLALAVPMFDQFGFKVTLFTITGLKTALPGYTLPNWNGLKAAAAEGHEVASHTVDHVSMDTLSAATQIIELKNSQDTINARIPGKQCITIATPYCAPGSETLDAQYYIAGRGCSGVIEKSTPADWMNISSLVCGPLGTVNTTAALNAQVESAAAAGGWCVFVTHGIDNDSGYSPLASSVLQAHVNYLNTNKAKFWVTSFGTVCRYIKERNAVSVSEKSNTGGIITLQVADGLDTGVYNIPITIRRPLPSGWVSATATQNGRALPCSIVTVSGASQVMFDAVPGAGDVVLSSSANAVENRVAPAASADRPMIASAINRTVNFAVKCAGTIEVYDVLGDRQALIRAGSDRAASSWTAPSTGAYLIRFDGVGMIETQRIVVR